MSMEKYMKENSMEKLVRKLDTRCQEGVELDVKIALTEAQQKLHTIFALVESHRTEQHYRKSHADLRLWEAVLGLKPQ